LYRPDSPGAHRSRRANLRCMRTVRGTMSSRQQLLPTSSKRGSGRYRAFGGAAVSDQQGPQFVTQEQALPCASSTRCFLPQLLNNAADLGYALSHFAEGAHGEDAASRIGGADRPMSDVDVAPDSRRVLQQPSAKRSAIGSSCRGSAASPVVVGAWRPTGSPCSGPISGPHNRNGTCAIPPVL